jgi:hypothetical protein
MILAGLPPQRAISLAAKSFKLWCYQMQLERNLLIAQMDHLNKKVLETKNNYEKIICKIKIKYETENEGESSQLASEKHSTINCLYFFIF